MNESHVFAKLVWCLLEIAAITVTIDDMVGSRAVALAGYLGRPIGQQLHIASQHDLDGAVNAASTLWQLRLGLLGYLRHCLTPCLAGLGLCVVCEGVAFPVVSCYNSYRSIPLCEGLTVGQSV